MSMTKNKQKDLKTIETIMQNVRERLIDSADEGNFDVAKKEIELLQGLLKIASLSENSKPQTIKERRAEREKLLEELNKKLSRLRQDIN